MAVRHLVQDEEMFLANYSEPERVGRHQGIRAIWGNN
jgi:hypothetical protein